MCYRYERNKSALAAREWITKPVGVRLFGGGATPDDSPTNYPAQALRGYFGVQLNVRRMQPYTKGLPRGCV